jgi:hypothetical protein
MGRPVPLLELLEVAVANWPCAELEVMTAGPRLAAVVIAAGGKGNREDEVDGKVSVCV